MDNKLMLLKLILPDSEAKNLSCDSVRIPLADDSKGRGGGLYGIRFGHAKAVLALGNGRVSAFQNGNELLSVNVAGGFARIENNVISLVTEKITEYD